MNVMIIAKKTKKEATNSRYITAGITSLGIPTEDQQACTMTQLNSTTGGILKSYRAP